MLKVFSAPVTAVPVTTAPPLPTHDFADAFAVTLPLSPMDAVGIASLTLTPMPRWISALIALRDRMVSPLRLKRVRAVPVQDIVKIGMFPILSSRADQVVLGFDDVHLDFRIVVDVKDQDTARMVTTTTFVKTHNAFGCGYLAMVIPFHKLIVRTLMARLVQRLTKAIRA